MKWYIFLSMVSAAFVALSSCDNAVVGDEQDDQKPDGTTASKWVKLAALGGPVRSICVASNGSIFAAADYKGVYRSTDQGKTWSSVLSNSHRYDLVYQDRSSSYLYAETAYNKGFFQSRDNGASWVDISSNFGGWQWYTGVFALANRSDGVLLAGMSGHLLASSNNGMTWKSLGIPSTGVVEAVLAGSNGQIIIAGTTGVGLVRSDDNGMTWSRKTTGTFYSLAALDARTILAGSNDDLRRSIDAGGTWSKVGIDPAGSSTIEALATMGSSVFCTGTRGEYISTDGGATWARVNDSAMTYTPLSLADEGGKSVLVGASGDGSIFRYTP
jgi:photosystem II stability/assembly factor-like uncharacterized protein